ncbi:uncharacterized protein LOC129808147 isoform X2 [Phlebotomus papatasi]|uniref:uncharacterized protein LOC129808147 isoform X2 n=1 Tax=Phlebotomus papatasi TaxID=29031 RepID=UPI00248339BA|nr:uncharacterized protein LOC129808147 isoform X2 [Phlebotomus papatasi]
MESKWPNEKREKLIELVRNEESLWRKATNHRRSDLDGLKWEIVAAHLDTTVDEAQKEWSGLKKSFYYQKNQRIPNGNGRGIKYKSKHAAFYEKLTFLEENMRGRRLDAIGTNVLVPPPPDYISDSEDHKPLLSLVDEEKPGVLWINSLEDAPPDAFRNTGNSEQVSIKIEPSDNYEDPLCEGDGMNSTYLPTNTPQNLNDVPEQAMNSASEIRPTNSNSFQGETFRTRPGRSRKVETQNRTDTFHNNLTDSKGQSLKENLTALSPFGNSSEPPGQVDSFLLFLKSIMDPMTSETFKEFRLKILKLYIESINKD